MKKITLLLAVLFTCFFGNAQTPLTAGDIAFMGGNSDGVTNADDNFAFVLLKDIDAATTIIFTDMGWNDATGFFSDPGDGSFTWTSGIARSAGDIITLTWATLAPGSATFGFFGDQIFAIQGTLGAPIFIAGLTFNNTGTSDDANWDGAATTNSTSARPNALTGNTAIRVIDGAGGEWDNFQFRCTLAPGGSPVTGTPDAIRTILHDRAYWFGTNDPPIFNPVVETGCTVTVMAATDTTPPVITCAPTPGPITAGIDGMAPIPDLVTGSSATDDVSIPANIVITQSPTAGTMVGVGVHMVTVTAMDEAGNMASCMINVTVVEPPSTVLSAGDIAFVGFNLDGGDGFAFILLKDIIAGTNIKITDCGVNNPNTINCVGGDSTNTWYAPAAMSAGDIVSLDGTFFTDPLASIGDQLLAFQGTIGSPIFIAGIHSNIEPGTTDADWDGMAVTNDESALPDQLINGVNAIRLHDAGTEIDNWQFDCSLVPGGSPISGTASNIASLINDIQYWINSDTVEFVPAAKATCAYTVIVSGDTTPPVISDCGPTPPDITADTMGNAILPDLTGGVVATDDVTIPANLTIVQSPAAGTTITAGVTVVTLFVSDEAGNTSTCTINVTVVNIVATTLAAGDIAFVGVNNDGTDEFAFILLKPVLAGTMITFTDCGVNNPNTISCIGVNDSTNTWFSPTDMPAGSIITLDSSFLTSLSNLGDQIFAYQGPVGNPVFIAGIHTSVVPGTNDLDWDAANTDGFTTALPDQLTNGVNAIRLHNVETEVDNWQFDCTLVPGGLPITGTPAQVAAIINDIQYWIFNDTTPFNPAAKAGCTYLVGATFTALADLCVDAGVQAGLGGGAPVGGVYSGPGVTDDGNGMTYSFDPAAAGVGTHTLTYTSGGSSAMDDVEVFALPAVAFTALADLCIDAGVQAGLGGGTPTGGVYSGPGVTDDGNGMTYSFDPAAAGVGTHTLTYTYTDANGCTGSDTDDVEVFALPTVTFTALADLCVNAGVQAGLGGGTPTGGVYSGPGVTDDGNGMTYSFDPAAAGVGTHTLTYTYTDANGCTGSDTDDVEVYALPTVTFTAPPSPVCPGDVLVAQGGGTPTGGVYSGPGITDDGNGMTYTFDSGASGNGTHILTYTFTDANGCTNSASDSVTVEDTTDPVVTCPADIIASNDPGQCDAVVTFMASATDNCPGVTTSSVPPSGSAFPVGTTVVTVTATDAAGNTDVCTFNVTVNDNEDPVVTCPADITVSNDPGQCDAVVTFTPTATDNCPGVTITSSPPSGSVFPVGTTIVTVTATDAGGSGGPITSPANTAILTLGNGNDGEAIGYNPVDGFMYHASGITAGQEYFEPIDLNLLTVGANLAPGNTWPAGLTQEVTGMVYYPPLNGFVAMDRSNNIALIDPVTTNFSSLSTFAGGGYIRGFAVIGTSIYGVSPFTSDLIEFNPNTGAVIATVPVVMDGTPITAGSNALTTDPASGDVYIVYKSGGPNRSLGIIDVTTGIGTGIGVIGVNFSGISFDASGNLYGVSGDGAAPPETLFKFDEAAGGGGGGGNTATCTFTVTVNDDEAPVVTCPADITVSNDPGQCDAVVTFMASATDNCPGVTTSSVPASGSVFPVGTTLVTVTATDAAGNTDVCTFNVTVDDNEDPVVTCPADITVNNDPGQCDAVVTFMASATDNCPGVTTSSVPPSGSAFPVGITTVTVTATDASGNTDVCTFDVTVIDNEDPVITCPADIMVDNDPTVCGAVVNYVVTASDNCAGMPVTQTFTFTGALDSFTVPAGVTSINIQAQGAQGGNAGTTDYPGGLGASMTGDFTVTPGEVLSILVGEQAATITTGNRAAGGGGGSFVVRSGPTPLIIAGGGGGRRNTGTTGAVATSHGSIGTSGQDATGTSGTGGSAGNGGTSSEPAGGGTGGPGGGFLTDGGPSGTNGGGPGIAFVNGGTIAPTCAPFTSGVATDGGFGGGGAGAWCFRGTPGGGGGYSGGGSGVNNSAGGGGGSFNSGTSQVNVGGVRSGDGIVVITYTNSGFTISQTAGLPSGSTFPVGTTTNTFVVTDASGNTDTCSFDITVNDTEDPVITCPADITVSNDPGVCEAFITVPQPTFSDNCGILSCVQTDDIDGYTLGPIFGQDVQWQTWTGNPAESAEVSNEQALSGTQSVKITGVASGGPVDQVYNLGNRVAGVWELTYSMYIPSGNTAYTNIQRFEAPTAGEWASEIQYHSDGTATYRGDGIFTNFVFPQDTWFELKHNIDQILDTSEFLVNGTSIVSHPFSQNANGLAGTNQLGGLNLYPITGLYGAEPNPAAIPLFYVDDLSLCEPGGPGAAINDYNNSSDASDTYPVGTTNVVWTVTDTAGNTASCTQVITVNDTEPPVANCVAPFTIQLDVNGMASITPADVDNGSTDNCGIASLAIAPSTFTCADVGPNTVTLTVTDIYGNMSTCTTTVTVEDNIPPVAVCMDIDVFLDATGNVSIVAADVDGGSNDACGIASLAVDIMDFTCADVGPNNVTLTVTDNNGNMSSCIAVVTVIDNIPPTIVCPADVNVNTDPGECTTVVVFPDALAIDNCGVASVMQTAGLPSGSMFPVGVSTVEYTATDVNGNMSVCSFTITVTDNEPAMAVCQDITIQLDANGDAMIVAADVDGGSTDNCGIASIMIDIDTFTCADVGPNDVTLTVTDVNGNVSSCIAVVTVEDVTPPVAVCMDITVQLDPTGTVTILGSDVDGGSTDACGIASYDLDIDTFDCSNVGPNPVVLTVTDVNGNVSTCTAVVTVEDVTDPILICMDITLELGADGTAMITPADVILSVDDACGINTTAIDISDFDCSDIGTPVTVTVFAIDNNGNTALCMAVVTVVDLLAPVVTCPADITVDPGPGNLFYEVPDYFALGEATAVDNCTDPLILLSQSPAVGTLLPDGVYPVTMTAEDEYGNIGTCTFTLTVESVLGVDDPELNIGTIVMYPNPAKDVVMLSNPQFIALEQATIYDLTGRLIQTIDLTNMGSEKVIDVTHLAAANYVVVIESEFGQIIKQLFKE